MNLYATRNVLKSLGVVALSLGLCAQLAWAERDERAPRGTWELEKMDKAQELATEDEKAVVFLVCKNPESYAKKSNSKGFKGSGGGGSCSTKSSCSTCPNAKGGKGGGGQSFGFGKDCPKTEATKGLIRDLERNAEIVYVDIDQVSELDSFVRKQIGKVNKNTIKAVVFNADLTSAYGSVSAKDWKKANKNRDRAGEAQIKRFQNNDPLSTSGKS